MPMPGFGELILIFAVVFLLFGAKKLPALGGAIGESIKNFKKGVKEDDSAKKAELEEAQNQGAKVSSKDDHKPV